MQSLTVFVIEDKPASRALARLAAELLAERLGRDLVLLTAINGTEAVQLLGNRPQVDLVLLDIHMPSPNVDGRLLVTLIRETLPGVPILAFTADRSDKMAADLRELNLGEPVIKPIAPEVLAERMHDALGQPSVPAPLPLQDVLADHIRQVAPLLEQRGSARPLRIAILARDHLALLGLRQLLTDMRPTLPVALLETSGRRDGVFIAVQQGVVDLLVSAPDAVNEAHAIAAAYGTPVLIYASATEAASLLDQPYSLVVGPSTNEELETAIAETLQARIYRNSYVVALLGLTARHRAILLRLSRGQTMREIADALAVSEDRVRHILIEIYDLLKLPHSRPALNAWMQAAPLHLFEL